MASAIAAARRQINHVGADGDLDGATAPSEVDLDVESVGDPIELPDGKLIYPPKLHGEPIDRLACALLDMQEPSRSRFLRLIGPPDPVSHCFLSITFGQTVQVPRWEPRS